MWAIINPLKNKNKSPGFTIVELLIVIVVIGILAAITIVAYNGVQGRAKDTRRLNDIASIRKALELYRADNGKYPPALNSNMSDTDPDDIVPGSGWESSSYGQSTWLDRLQPYMSGQKAPVDPTNDTTHYYYYYFYTGNAPLCGSQTPNCYVLGISKLDSMNSQNINGVDKSGNDVWRNTAVNTRAVWHGAY